MAKTSLAKAYEFTVQGEYYARSGKEIELKHYGPYIFILPEHCEIVEGRELVEPAGGGPKISTPIIKKVHALKCYQHVIQRMHLKPRLKEELPDFKSFRTCEVTKKREVQVNASGLRSISKTAVDEMTESELIQFCMLNDLRTHLNSYTDLADKRLAVKREWGQKQAERAEADLVEDPDAALLQPPEDISVETGDEIQVFEFEGANAEPISSDSAKTVTKEVESKEGSDLF